MVDATIDPLSGAREVAPGVFVFTSGAYALNSGVVLGGASPGCPGALLVDPGYFPGDLDRIAGFLESRGHEASRILLTHSDWDHVTGPVRFPRASVIASSLYPPRVESDGERIVRSLEELDRKLYVRREPPFAIPLPDSLVGSPCDLVWDGPPARLVTAGGHTPDGLMLILREPRLLFAGDHLSDREIPFVGESVEAYVATLAAVRSLVSRGEVETLVPGHGDVCARREILERLDEDADYLSRLDSWVHETRRIVDSIDGILERCDEVVFRKGWGSPDVHAEHRANVARHANHLGLV